MKHSKIYSTILFSLLTILSSAQQPYLVHDINKGEGSSRILELTVWQDKLIFQAEDKTGNLELWMYDSDSAYQILDINNVRLSSEPILFVHTDSLLFFSAIDEDKGRELWVFNGKTAERLTDGNYSPGGSYPTHLTELDGDIYFTSSNANDERELHKLDGKTLRITKIVGLGTNSSTPQKIMKFGNDILFKGSTPNEGEELWKYDGTSVTKFDIYKGPVSSNVKLYTTYNNMVIFSARDEINGQELWGYDGTKPILLADINPGGSSFVDIPIEYNGSLYFHAYHDSYGAELWKYDGTNASMVADNRPGIMGTVPTAFHVFDNKLLYQGYDINNQLRIYSYDGTQITEVNKAGSSTCPRPSGLPITYNNRCFLGATENSTLGLWEYKNGAFVLIKDSFGVGFKDLEHGATSYAYYRNSLYFTAGTSSTGTELWKLPCSGSTDTTINIKSCGPYTLPGTYRTYNKSGTYTYTIPNATGCDSIITVKLTVNDFSSEVQTSGGVLTAVYEFGNYQWLDCDDNFKPITNATNRVFIPNKQGNYAVRVSIEGCKDTSVCENITKVSTANINANNIIRAYPNPSSGVVFIDLGKTYGTTTITVKNTLGQEVYTSSFDDTQQIQIPLIGDEGVYFIEIETNTGERATLKVLLQ